MSSITSSLRRQTKGQILNMYNTEEDIKLYGIFMFMRTGIHWDDKCGDVVIYCCVGRYVTIGVRMGRFDCRIRVERSHKRIRTKKNLMTLMIENSMLIS